MAFLLPIDIGTRRIDLVWVIAKSFTLGPCTFPVIDSEPLRLLLRLEVICFAKNEPIECPVHFLSLDVGNARMVAFSRSLPSKSLSSIFCKLISIQ